MTLLAEIALVVLSAGVVAVCLARLPVAAAQRTRARPPSPPRPEQLIELERLVSNSAASAVTVHAYLRPQLVEITGRRLVARGRSLDAMSDADGAGLLGESLWDLVRPDRPFPEDRQAPGITSSELAAMLGVLERL
ncbi:MAG: hypothetical protein ACRDPM_17165 [Solirubrobacteraceae bacterium]